MTSQALNRPVDVLAQEIRRVDGSHSLGAGALAEALMPFIEREFVARAAVAELIEAAGEIISHTRGCEILLQVDEQPTTQRLRAALAAIGSRP